MHIGITPVRQRGVLRGPTRQLRELADEFGVTTQQLIALHGHYSGPKPLAHLTSNAKGGGHYSLNEMRRWWATVPEDVKAKAQRRKEQS